MTRRPPMSTRTDKPFVYTTPVRAESGPTPLPYFATPGVKAAAVKPSNQSDEDDRAGWGDQAKGTCKACDADKHRSCHEPKAGRKRGQQVSHQWPPLDRPKVATRQRYQMTARASTALLTGSITIATWIYERQSVVAGKSVDVSVDVGVIRTLTKKKQI